MPRGGLTSRWNAERSTGCPRRGVPRACRASRASWQRLCGATRGGAALARACGGGSRAPSSAGRTRSGRGATRPARGSPAAGAPRRRGRTCGRAGRRGGRPATGGGRPCTRAQTWRTRARRDVSGTPWPSWNTRRSSGVAASATRSTAFTHASSTRAPQGAHGAQRGAGALTRCTRAHPWACTHKCAAPFHAAPRKRGGHDAQGSSMLRWAGVVPVGGMW